MNKEGFTLIELLVVVLIVGVLSAIALPQYTTSIERARASEAMTLMSAIRYAAERYRFQHDEWPRNNTWSDLDVNVPTIPGSSNRGGKNFKVTMTRLSNGKFLVLAERSIASGKYYLKTILTDNTSSDTITAVRCCTSSSSSDDSCPAPTGKALTFCNAITGAHNSDF
jgi:prepilin-type N-terminal cleavage/methylation domain-containing protein